MPNTTIEIVQIVATITWSTAFTRPSFPTGAYEAVIAELEWCGPQSTRRRVSCSASWFGRTQPDSSGRPPTSEGPGNAACRRARTIAWRRPVNDSGPRQVGGVPGSRPSSISCASTFRAEPSLRKADRVHGAVTLVANSGTSWPVSTVITTAPITSQRGGHHRPVPFQAVERER
jgi:hypothetical protein